MDKRELSKLVRAAGRMLLALGFVFSQTAWAAQNPSMKENPAPASKTAAQQSPVKVSPSAPAKADSVESETPARQSAAEETAAGGGPHEGIKVHGHWTIEVRNPDGKVVSHREFENALFPSPALASLLARQVAAGFWTIALSPGTVCGNTNNAGCSIAEPGNTLNLYNSYNLSVTVSGTSLVLSGTVLAAGGGSITTVQTGSQACAATVAPSAPCQNGSQIPTVNFGFGPGGGFIFTSTDPSPAISVAAGQTVAVTVNISFS
jgi:hypothetical protein